MALSDNYTINKPEVMGHSNDWVNGVETPQNQYVMTPNVRTGLNVSQSHKRDRDGKYRSGGAWQMYKQETFHTPSASVRMFRYGYDTPAYVGRLVSSGHVVNYATPSGFNDTAAQSAALKLRGAEAWNRLRPDNPDFSMATSVAELKDFVPFFRDALKDIVLKIAGVKRQRRVDGKSELSKAAQGHLAASFGYLPLLSDIRNYVKAHKGAQKRLSQLIRDAGKPVRRITHLKDNSTLQQVGLISKAGYNNNIGANFHHPIQVTQCYQADLASGRTTSYDYVSFTWAEGSFCYALPPGPRDVNWNKRMYNRIMGKRITPDTLYQLMPWSWLIDYFSDLGKFIESVSAGVADRLYCKYAYLMQTKIQRFKTVCTTRVYASSDGTQTTQLSASLITNRVAKVRVVASPFGWGIKQSDLSLKQLAILGALGLSRLP